MFLIDPVLTRRIWTQLWRRRVTILLSCIDKYVEGASCAFYDLPVPIYRIVQTNRFYCSLQSSKKAAILVASSPHSATCRKRRFPSSSIEDTVACTPKPFESIRKHRWKKKGHRSEPIRVTDSRWRLLLSPRWVSVLGESSECVIGSRESAASKYEARGKQAQQFDTKNFTEGGRCQGEFLPISSDCRNSRRVRAPQLQYCQYQREQLESRYRQREGCRSSKPV